MCDIASHQVADARSHKVESGSGDSLRSDFVTSVEQRHEHVALLSFTVTVHFTALRYIKLRYITLRYITLPVTQRVTLQRSVLAQD